ncbi:MAG: NAD(P)-dependent oxidoreductase [Clostridium sp.]|nr:NAD(P)-dependent oxidoreductase [Clostridium sp.]
MDSTTTDTTARQKVLVVGAGGFIGGFIAAEGIRRGHEVWCGVRPSTSRRFLTDPSLHFVELDYEEPQALADALAAAAPDGGWDWIIYNLGATKCTNFMDFNRINFRYLCNFTEALRSASLVPQRFLYMSSLSALGPGDEEGYTPLSSSTIPRPNTRYGVSKIKAETHLQTLEDFPWIIFRPTGVYGPHEQDYLMMVKSIDRHWDFGVGFRRQMLTFIYVEDLAAAIYDALAAPEGAVEHKKYIISEPRAYTQAEFRRIVADALGRRFVIPVRLPLWAVRGVSVVAEKIGVLRMKPSTLNSDKYRIMKQRNWSCDTSDAVRDFGFSPRFSLAEGIAETVRAYRAEKEKEKK